MRLQSFTPFIFLAAASMIAATPVQPQTQADSDSQSSASVSAATDATAVVYNQGDTIYSDGLTRIEYGGSYDVETVPNVTAPGIVTAHNCLRGYSGGASILGGGLSLGGTVIDKNCETISQAAAINTLAGRRAAVAHLATIPEVCRTLRASGAIGPQSVCPGDPEKKVATVASKGSARPARKTKAQFSYCGRDADGTPKVRFRKRHDQVVGMAQCKARLGIN